MSPLAAAPDSFSLATLGATAAVFAAAGVVKGVVGLGLPTVSLTALTLFMPVPQAQALIVVPSLVTNVWQGLAGGRLPSLWRRLGPMLAGIAAGVAAEAVVGLNAHPRLAAGILGVAIVSYAVSGLASVRLHVRAAIEPMVGPAAGVATGVIAGATGVFVIPSVMYLQALDLDRDELVQALGLTFTVATVAMGAGLLGKGQLGPVIALVSLAALVPALIGMEIGRRVRAAIAAATFRLWLNLALLAAGMQLVAKALL